MWKFGLCCLNCFSRNDLNTTFRRTGKLTHWSLNVVLQLTATGQIYYSINHGEHIPHFNFSCGDNNNNKITGQKWANAPLYTAIHHIQNFLCKIREATITLTGFLFFFRRKLLFAVIWILNIIFCSLILDEIFVYKGCFIQSAQLKLIDGSLCANIMPLSWQDTDGKGNNK